MAIKIKNRVNIIAWASVGGCEEAEGPLGALIDMCDCKDDTFAMKNWEAAESEMQRLALGMSISGAGLTEKDITAIFAGDLLNQCVGSSYGLLEYDIPYMGLYGACSTAAEGLLLASLMVSAGNGTFAAVASSHNAAAERQFRSPVEYGGQRTPTSQWTVTGAASFILSHNGEKNSPRVCSVEMGRSIDSGLTDISNMGAAMAPAAADTLLRYFEETGTLPSAYDLIVTGDLGIEGSAILCDIMAYKGYDISSVYGDCGLMIYNIDAQDKHAGGSGCGCSAVVMASYILPMVKSGKLKNVLFVGTGALMSPMSLKEGMTIAGIAHLVQICGGCDD